MAICQLGRGVKMRTFELPAAMFWFGCGVRSESELSSGCNVGRDASCVAICGFGRGAKITLELPAAKRCFGCGVKTRSESGLLPGRGVEEDASDLSRLVICGLGRGV